MHRNPFVTQMRFDQENYRDRVRDVTFLHFLWRWLNAIYTSDFILQMSYAVFQENV